MDCAELLGGDDCPSGAGGADDQIRGGKGRVQFPPGAGPPVPMCGQLAGALETAVDNGYQLCPFVPKVTQRLLRHFAGADDERLLVVEAFEDSAGEVGHCHAGNAHSALVDGGFGGYAAGDADGRLESLVQERPGCLALRGRLIGLLHLGEDLRFAQHHAVQAGCHAEQVPHRRFVGIDEQVGHDVARIDAMDAGQEYADLVDVGTAPDWLAA